jgi:hypothetical protein
MNMKALHTVSYILLFIGGLNWGLVGLLQLNLVELIFGNWPVVVKTVYILVGVSAVYVITTHKKDCKVCDSK